jgi:hypothetical protein
MDSDCFQLFACRRTEADLVGSACVVAMHVVRWVLRVNKGYVALRGQPRYAMEFVAGANAIKAVCCPFPLHVCPGSGVCCPPFNKCCQGQCCDDNQQCHPTLGICCSTICGPACCGANQSCQDQSEVFAGIVQLASMPVRSLETLPVVPMAPNVAEMASAVRPAHVVVATSLTPTVTH